MVLPVVNALRRAFPDTHISWVLQPGPASLVQGHRAVDQLIPFHRKGGGGRFALVRGMANLRATAQELRSQASGHPGGAFDLLLDLQVYLKAGLLTALSPARLKLGFDRRRARDLNWLFTTHRIPPHPQRFGHVQEQYFEFLRHIGVNPKPVDYGIRLGEEERRDQEAFFSTLEGSACAVVLGTSNPAKNWSSDGYAEVLDGLSRTFGLQPVLVGGRSPTEDAMACELLHLVSGPVVDAREDNLRRLLWLLDGAALVISPDTGPLHIARALDVPVVGLFGLTNPKRSGPYGKFSELVVDGYARYPQEEYEATPARRPGGMARITPGMVLEKVGEARRRYGGGAPSAGATTPPPPALPQLRLPGEPAPGWLPGEPPGSSPPRS